ncbi:hypothetical protein UO65_5605 [Actinokineospora spheciospongiae]|uniref:DUF4333 domain-containing protein n=1 Tax=Actinokineospora spheciospongiae TaxID=909613 RepID=W7IYL3_9PSEU|nr:DUF4333 domain-containing protein [Actinokineospora spheciospongiae]EWC59114.1 hypothetical protein UO65_5605 [Actinokineospora spheciospongiae]PWW63068.1 uncharacterized protein DUF4333 [Actinokineospora spheciospongiae]
MSSPYGPSGGQDPQQQWGQQPYGGGNPPGTPSGGFPQQGGGYPQQPGQSPYPPEQGQYGYQQQPQQPYQPTQQQPQTGQQPGQQYPGAQQSGYGPPTGQQPQFGGYNPNQPQGGMPPGYPGAPAEKKGGGAGIWIAVVAVVLVAGVVAVLAFVTPGFANTKVFDQNAVQDGVKSILTGKYSVENVESVSCPADQEVKKDARFTCDVTIGGEQKKVNITVRSDEGEYEVAPPSDG